MISTPSLRRHSMMISAPLIFVMLVLPWARGQAGVFYRWRRICPRRPNDELVSGPETLKREEQRYERPSSKERAQYGAAAARDARRGRLNLQERSAEHSHGHHSLHRHG